MSVSLSQRAPRPSLFAVLGAWLALVVRPRRVATRRLLPPMRRLWLGGLIGAVLVVGAMLLIDRAGVAFAHALPLWVNATFNELTDFGKSGWFLIPIAGAIVLAALMTPTAGRLGTLVLTSLVVRLEFVFLAIALPSLIVTIVKRLIGRVRPSELGPFAYLPFSWRSEFASLPSGHATSAVAAAVAIGAVWPRARIPMWIYAAIIAASRVIIEAHFVSDVIAAAFVGGFGALLVRNWFAARRLGFVPGTDGAVQALPGPSWRRVKTVARRLLAA